MLNEYINELIKLETIYKLKGYDFKYCINFIDVNYYTNIKDFIKICYKNDKLYNIFIKNKTKTNIFCFNYSQFSLFMFNNNEIKINNSYLSKFIKHYHNGYYLEVFINNNEYIKDIFDTFIYNLKYYI